MNQEKNKVLIIGLDGATFDILNPLMEKGLMPNLKKIKDHGAWGELLSSIPPITGPSWTSFATGRNPGKTGVFDFMIKEKGNYELKPITSSYLKSRSIWDYLSRDGKRSIVLNYPTLFPTYEINGIMVSGIGSYKGDGFSYPREVENFLDELTGEYEIGTEFTAKKYKNNEDLYFRDSHQVFRKKVQAAKYFLENEDWDFFAVIFCETDFSQHFLWKHIDSSHPLFIPQISPGYKDKFEKYYHDIDVALGELWQIAGGDTNIFIVSDHGFGPSNLCFRPNLWLEKKGYLVKNKLPLALAIKKKIMILLKVIMGKRIREYVSKKISRENKEKLKVGVLSEINWNKTKALSLEHTGPLGAFYIVDNLSAEEKKDVKNNLLRDLEKLPEEYGSKFKPTVYDPSEIYWGDRTSETPDIIFTIANWNCLMKNYTLSGPVCQEMPCNPAITGSHRPEGILMAAGPGIKEGVKIDGAKIFDIMPTCLYLLNSSIPNEVDGKVLRAMLHERFLKNDFSDFNMGSSEKESMDNQIEEEKIKDKLKGLGYL